MIVAGTLSCSYGRCMAWLPTEAHPYSHLYMYTKLIDILHCLVFGIVFVLPSLQYAFTYPSIFGEKVEKLPYFERGSISRAGPLWTVDF